MENMNNVAEVANVVEETVVATSPLKKVTPGQGTLLGFAAVGVISTGYFLYKGGKWAISKIKAKATSKAAAEDAPEAQEGAKEVPTDKPTEE